MILGKWWISQCWTLKIWLNRVLDHLILVMLCLGRLDQDGPWGLLQPDILWSELGWYGNGTGWDPAPGAEHVLGLPQVLSWTHLPWVAAENEAPSLCKGSSGLSVYKGVWSFAKVVFWRDWSEGSSVTFLVKTSWENQGGCSWQPDLVIACGLCMAQLCRGANYCK